MGRRKGNKRKQSNGSVDNSHDSHDSHYSKPTPKAGRYTRTSEGVSVSSLLSQTNSVLFEDEERLCLRTLFDSDSDSESFDSSINSGTEDDSLQSASTNMATPQPSPNESSPVNANSNQTGDPSNADIMNFLKGLKSTVKSLDRRLVKLECLDSKIDKFEAEMKKLWLHINDENKKMGERVHNVEEKVDATDFSLGLMSDKVIHLEKERDLLKDEVVYLQSQSMRNNLIFGNIPEADQREDTEQVVRDFMVDKLKLARSMVDEIQFERVHRMGPKSNGNAAARSKRDRNLVAKFNLYKEREHVRKQSKALKGTNFFVQEQFPREISERRRKLLPQLREAKGAGKQAWLSYDKLYVDGKQVDAKS